MQEEKIFRKEIGFIIRSQFLEVVAVNGKKLFIDQGARLGTVNRDCSVKKGE